MPALNPTPLPGAYTGPLPAEVHLPDVDVRTRLNERAFRNWTESSRRVVRVAGLMASDIAAGLLGVAAVLATWEIVSAGGVRPLPDRVPLVAMVFCLMPLALRVTGAYAGGKARTDVLKVGAGVAIAAFLGWVQAQLFGREVPELPNKAAYVYSALVITAIAWLFRLLLDWVIATGYGNGILQRRVLVVGTQSEAEALHRQASRARGCDFQVIGRLEAHETDVVVTKLALATSRYDVPYAGTVKELEQAISATGAQGLIVASNLPFARLEALVGTCFRLGAMVSILPHALKQLSTTQMEVRQSAVGSLLQLRPARLDLPQLAVKRTMDVILTLAGLAVTWPLFVLIAIAIKLDSRGPVLFRQERVGVGGRRFHILKFRTMIPDAERLKASLQHMNEYSDGRLFKIKKDPRITRLGRLLRRTSFDELPQLWNVIRGDMSLVGPRPCVPEEFEQYAPHHLERVFVTPGVTGPWQVNGRNVITDFEEVVRLDLEYIKSWSLLSDIIILVRTVPTLFHRGAY